MIRFHDPTAKRIFNAITRHEIAELQEIIYHNETYKEMITIE